LTAGEKKERSYPPQQKKKKKSNHPGHKSTKTVWWVIRGKGGAATINPKHCKEGREVSTKGEARPQPQKNHTAKTVPSLTATQQKKGKRGKKREPVLVGGKSARGGKSRGPSGGGGGQLPVRSPEMMKVLKARKKRGEVLTGVPGKTS